MGDGFAEHPDGFLDDDLAAVGIERHPKLQMNRLRHRLRSRQRGEQQGGGDDGGAQDHGAPWNLATTSRDWPPRLRVRGSQVPGA